MPVPPLDPLVSVAEASLRRWMPEVLALVLGGSHARGEAVRVTLAGRSRCLSDLDLHAVLPDRASAARAAGAVSRGRPTLLAELEALGLAAPLDLGIHTPEEWATTPARPATLELRRSGSVIFGDQAWRDRLPAWTPRDVSAEERRLLLENRAFELLAARELPDLDPDGLAFARACHAQYKCALDLAGVDRLEHGVYETSAAERVHAARGGDRHDPTAGEPAWDAALAWLRGEFPHPEARENDWWRIAAGWVTRWRRAVSPGRDPADFDGISRDAARRAPARRRVRLAIRPEMPRGNAPPLGSRLRFALAGTPQHRLNASAGATLAALTLARSGEIPRERALERLDALLATLGAVPGTRDERAIALSLRATWDRWVMGETRGSVVT